MLFEGTSTLCVYLLVLTVFCSALDPEIHSESKVDDIRVCGDIEIWSADDSLVSVLKNCTIVEGHVRLVEAMLREDVTFPALREITGYLMLFRTSGVHSLRNVFPNLSVIRGNSLFNNFALVIFEVFDLKSISLTSLVHVLKGDLFIASNFNLCYTDLVDWNAIAPGNRKNYIANNKSPNECALCGNCAKSVNDKKACWSMTECQVVCPTSCPSNCNSDGECCHSSCLGGCRGLSPEDCYSCKNYRYQDSCVDSCPKNTFVYKGWKCTLESECYNLPQPLPNKSWKLHNSTCLLDCPPGYQEVNVMIGDKKRTECLQCKGGSCRKECWGGLISNVEDSRKMIGCTVILGGLMISLSGYNKDLISQLEKNLNGVEEITGYLKVSDSFQLTSLNFLRNLKYIKGEVKYNSKYSLVVAGNKNLELLWDFDRKKGFKIDGPIYFRSNPKLCAKEINRLMKEAGIPPGSFDPSLTNGRKNVCDLSKLPVNVKNITSSTTFVEWKPFESHDMRNLMGFAIYIKEALHRNITVFDGRNECRGGGWKVYDVSFFDCCASNYTIKNLKAFTDYALYVKTVTVNVDFGAQSEITYFKTLPGIPVKPFELNVKTNSSSGIYISWLPPLVPNGIVSHYLVSISRVAEEYIDSDRCEEEGLDVAPSNSSHYVETDLGFGEYSDESNTLPHDSKSLSQYQRQRNKEIHFENKLQNYIYVKRRPKRFIMLGNESSNNGSVTSIEQMTGNTSYYDENFQIDEGNETILKFKEVNGTSLHISNLRHFTKYRVDVQACRELVDGENRKSPDDYCGKKSSHQIRTFPSRASDAIPDEYPLLEVSNEVPGTVTLKWEGPRDPNGNIVSYTVEYRRLDYMSLTECVTNKQFVKSSRMYTLRKLRPGNYSVRIRTNSVSGAGPFTSLKYFYIKDDTSIHTYIYLILGTLLFILPPALAYCVYYLREMEKNKMFLTVNPEYVHKIGQQEIDAWELPRSQIDLLREIGQGSFGMVYEGLLNGKPCAVKTVNAQASEGEKREFLNEACVMKSFDTFHVVCLLGIVSVSEPVYVVMELMPNGDLKSFLRSHRPDVSDSHVRPPSVRRLLQMSTEIADGMAYLAAKKYVHRDLAARNCMVTENLTVKIGDFGMARDIYIGDYYRKGSRGLMPVRWMAPESLRDGVFLSASDVWSYGVVLYEMVTLAAQPYQGLSNDQVLRYVTDGGIMERPENCSDKMYRLMRECWMQDPGERPTFIQIVEALHEDASLNFHTVSFYDSSEGRKYRASLEPSTNGRESVDQSNYHPHC